MAISAQKIACIQQRYPIELSTRFRVTLNGVANPPRETAAGNLCAL
jgi:hypothetical protein